MRAIAKVAESAQETPKVSSKQEKVAPAKELEVLKAEVRSIKAPTEAENLGNTAQSAIDDIEEFLNIEITIESAPETTLSKPKTTGVTAEANPPAEDKGGPAKWSDCMLDHDIQCVAEGVT